MRGKLSIVRRRKQFAGITPAGAGKTYILNCEVEHLAGSPPQVRGKLSPAPSRISTCRITPAGAGKTRHKADHDKRPEDHPRRCGENTAIIPPITATRGSPPQVRGKRGGGGGEAFLPRITPAGAGKTCLSVQLCPTRQDHPRRCGENMSVAKGLNAGAGSPPQVRGKQKMSRTRNYATRITPAGAGKTTPFV